MTFSEHGTFHGIECDGNCKSSSKEDMDIVRARLKVAKVLAERQFMECLNRLGDDLEIKVRPVTEAVGHLALAIA